MSLSSSSFLINYQGIQHWQHECECQFSILLIKYISRLTWCQWLWPPSYTQRTSLNLLKKIRASQQLNWRLLLCISWSTKVVTLIFCNQILEFRLLNPWEVPLTSVQCSQSPAAFFGNLSTFLFKTGRGGWTDLESEHQI